MDIAFAGDTHLVETTPRSRKDVFYQSVLKKMEYVIFNNDVTIFLGDLFHKPATSNVVMSGLMDLLIRAEQAGKRVYTIIGNHDVPMASVEEENLSKTSLNILFKTGLIKELKCETFGPLVVEAIPFVRKTDNLSFYTEHRPSILIGHYFFNSPLDPHFSILPHQIEESNYVSLILGHDHEPATPIDIGTTTVIIPGALSRGTSHRYNLTRKVRYCKVKVNELTGLIQHQFEDVPTLPSKDVFYEDAFKKPNESNYAFVANMESLLEAFSKANNSDGKITLKEALEIAGTPSYVVEYLRSVHKRLLIDF